MIHLLSVAVFVVFMIAVHAAYGIAHFRDINRILATIQDASRMRELRRKRYLLLAVSVVPLILLAISLPDPWPSRFAQYKLDDDVTLERFDQHALSAVTDDKWQTFKPSALRYLTFETVAPVIRVKIPSSSKPTNYVAEVPFPFLTKIDFLLLQDGKTVKSGQAGLDRPLVAATHRGLYYSFDIPTDSAKERWFYARVGGEGLAITSLTIYSEEEFEKASLLRTTVIALTVGAFMGILIYNLALFFSMRERMYLYYFSYQAILCIFMLSYTGMAASLMPGIANNTYYITSYMQFEMLVLLIIPLSLFYNEFLSLKANFLWGYRSMRFISVLGILVVPALAMMNLGVAALTALAYLGVDVLVIIIYYLPLINYRYVAYFILSFLGIGVCVIIHLLGLFGILPANFFIDFMFGFGSVWEAVFLSLAIGDRINMMKAERKSIASALDGKKSLSKLNQVLGRSFARNYVPREWNVSIVFVDIAGFSRLTERMPSAQLYHQLATEMREITRIVKEHNGSIDRSLGDGLLCYFGYEKGSSPIQHARDAFNAALEIQKRSIDLGPVGSNQKPLVFPLCIGINIANVLVANLSEAENDFTMIGSGVNLASRLNAVCSPFRIIVSEDFMEMLQESGNMQEMFHEIFVSIKHQEHLLKAYECNPFMDSPALLATAEQTYLEMLGYSRKEGRFRVQGQRIVQLVSPHGKFVICDFSLGGLGIRGLTAICRKSVIPVELVSDDATILHPLSRHMLQKVQAEVRWCCTAQGEFEHGLRFIGLNATQKEILFNFFRELFELTALHQAAHDTDDTQDDLRFGT